MTGDELARHTAAVLAATAPAPLLIACSGGSDSAALLHILAALPEARRRGLRAIHVDHGIHADSAVWSRHCRAACARLDVALEIRTVNVTDDRGEGLEAAARRARYAAFAEVLRDGETLVTAHHRDDQVETVLLKLLRGAGPAGLAGMRAARPFARGTLWRPWLAVPKSAIRDWNAAHGLETVEDPSNLASRHVRNHLRHRVLPLLQEAFPQAAASILHSATLCAVAADHIEREADAALAQITDDHSLDVTAWLALDDAVRAVALERWLHRAGLPAPTTAQRRELERQARISAPDRVPCTSWPRAEARLWRKRLYAMSPLPPPAPDWRVEWRGEAIDLPLGRLLPRPGVTVHPGLEVRMPTHGLRLRFADDAHTRNFNELLRMRGEPPWRRPFCPLLYRDGEPVAVPEVGVTLAGRDEFPDASHVPLWRRD